MISYGRTYIKFRSEEDNAVEPIRIANSTSSPGSAIDPGVLIVDNFLTREQESEILRQLERESSS